MIKDCGKNDFGHFWQLHIPPDIQTKECDLEVSIMANNRGVRFGGELISWDELDEARELGR